jgi:hypothetical protein
MRRCLVGSYLRHRSSDLLAVLAAFVTMGQANAQTPLPLSGVITQPGRYFLPSDLNVARSTGIDIQANDVTLDLRGHALRFTDIPREGTFGITSFDRNNVRITNGTIGGFWFNIHASQNGGLQIDNVAFDNIPYIGINAADSENVQIHDNVFSNFRYDIPKPTDKYVIGVNIGARDSVVSRNRFDAVYAGADPHQLGIETVLVLFSASVSLRSVVAHNTMQANTPLNRSYGVWIASNAHVTAAHNTIENLRYGITLASAATALASYNTISVNSGGSPPLPSTFGVFAASAEQVFETGNQFAGLTHPTFLPAAQGSVWDNTNVALMLDVSDLGKSALPGIGYDQIVLPGEFKHGGSVAIDVSKFAEGSDFTTDLKLLGWKSESGNRSSTAVSFFGGSPRAYEFRTDGLYLTNVRVNFIPEPTTTVVALTGLIVAVRWDRRMGKI